MPSPTGVVQDAGVPRIPSMATTHSRHEPNASRLSVAHSFGTAMPASAAARITLVPAGTVTAMPSTISETLASDRTAGVPRSRYSGMMKSFIRQPPPARRA